MSSRISARSATVGAPEDLARWCEALFTEGEVLSSASLAEMLTFVVERMSTEERRAEQANADRDRREHKLNRTPPERMRAPLKAKYGDEQGHPDAFVRHVAELFVEELRRGQRGVYKRLGERMGKDWSTARSRVMIAVKRGLLVWTGADREPAGHLPGEEPFDPPGSFEFMFRVLVRRVEQVGDAALPDSEVFEGEALGYWARRMKTLERKGRLRAERVARLEALPGWQWVARSGADGL